VTNYDAITEQFGPALSDLARRMYAGLFDVVTNPRGQPEVVQWPTDSAGEAALRELILCGLVEPVRGGSTVSYRPTSRAWRAHLLAERAEALKSKQKLMIGNCARCGIPLDAVGTGIFIYERGDERHTVCYRCAEYFADAGYVVVEQLHSTLDDAIEGRR
jgi:hypothetical protein